MAVGAGGQANAEAIAAYRRASIGTASPTGLIALLLRRAVQELGRAEEILAVRDGGRPLPMEAAQAARRHLRLAQEILSTLRASLRRDLEHELPARLDALYDFAYWRAVTAHARLEAQACRAARVALEPLARAWDEAFRD
ncbi:MAG: flagellar protein FliS [Clostridia bacterium]|nr:flagellar protein FliS [Clostridia bacterium]